MDPIFSCIKEMKKNSDDDTVFMKATPRSTYLPFGNRRIYTTGWLSKWVEYERDYGAVGYNGQALTCYRPRIDGKRHRYYYDMSRVDTQVNVVYDRELYSPVDTKYMTSHYVNDMSLKELAMLGPEQFVKVINGRTR